MKVVQKQLKQLKMYENNPRNNDIAVQDVAKSISEFGFKVPMVIDKNDVIVCGHTRYKACLELGIEEVPCVVADDLTDDQIKAFRLVENKTNELATWDFEKLDEELKNIEIDFSNFNFDFDLSTSWFEKRKTWDNSKQEGNEEYNDFLEQFEIAKTTDDCYTPKNVYEVIATHVEQTYGLDRDNFVRPFYPNGDYQKEKYKDSDIVVDNPPFSILKEIIEFYSKNNIKYFLFAPAMTSFGNSAIMKYSTIIFSMCSILYENGAKVPTNFLTNLEDSNLLFKVNGDLQDKIEKANNENQPQRKINRYQFPIEVVTSAMMGKYAKYKIDFEVKRDEVYKISKLDAQEGNDAIYGGGILISKNKVKERELKEIKVYELSEREKQIVEHLGGVK